MYILCAALIQLLDPGPVGYTLSVRKPADAPFSEPLLLLLPPYKIPLIAFALVASPVLAVLLRAFKRGRASEVQQVARHGPAATACRFAAVVAFWAAPTLDTLKPP